MPVIRSRPAVPNDRAPTKRISPGAADRLIAAEGHIAEHAPAVPDLKQRAGVEGQPPVTAPSSMTVTDTVM